MAEWGAALLFGMLAAILVHAGPKQACEPKALDWMMSRGRAGIYVATLKQFSRAIRRVLDLLEMELDVLKLNGYRKVQQLANDRLVAFAIAIIELETERDNASGAEFEILGNAVQSRRMLLKERFDSLAALGLTKSDYTQIFRTARIHIESPVAA